MRTNVARAALARKFDGVTHEGAPARRESTEVQLRRAILSCLLWEHSFYESGESIADRIVSLASELDPNIVADLAIEARKTYWLRHAPLLLLTVLAETGASVPKLVADTVDAVIQRADEPGELLALYWRDGRKPIPAQFKKGLARALTKFDEYQLAKYNSRDAAVKIRDVLFLTHAKPESRKQAKLWKKLANGELEAPDTWEVALSAGDDKKETFERLIREGNLGYLALLRNLRGMTDAKVNRKLVVDAILARNGAKNVWPFRYVAAARACPSLEPAIDQALLAAIEDIPPLPGSTIVLVDVSGSMRDRLSDRSDMTRMDAAAALASIIPSKNLRVFTFSNIGVEVAPRRGMAGVDAIIGSQQHGGTELGRAVKWMEDFEHDRLIVITDEQSSDKVPAPVAEHAYMINVASYKPSVAYGPWTKIEGWSEGVIRYIQACEER